MHNSLSTRRNGCFSVIASACQSGLCLGLGLMLIIGFSRRARAVEPPGYELTPHGASASGLKATGITFVSMTPALHRRALAS